jgi:lipoprotein-anchoring transpeptidase ErfK/SrfK
MQRSKERSEGRSKAEKAAGRLFLALALVLAPVVSARGQNTKDITDALAGQSPRRQVVVSIPDRKLAVLENGKLIRTFPVAVGAAVSPSPVGEFQIVNRVANPTYYHPGVVIAPGSDSPIGPRWVGLSRKGFGIHGTNEPRSIGKAASHGCIRLRNSDIKLLFAMVSVGDTVEVRGERDEQIAQIFGGAVATAVAPNDAALAQAQPMAVNAVTGGQ